MFFSVVTEQSAEVDKVGRVGNRRNNPGLLRARLPPLAGGQDMEDISGSVVAEADDRGSCNESVMGMSGGSIELYVARG